MNKKQLFSVAFPFLCIALLLPILSYPFAPDISCFVMGGKAILGGSKLYVDYIDLKSPIVYYFTAGVMWLFGEGAFNIRLFDFIWQFCTAMSLFYFVRKFFDANLARISALVYCFVYVLMVWDNTMECETTIALPLVWAIGLFVTESSRLKRYIIAGVLLSFVVAFKYTLGVAVFPFFYLILFDKTEQIRIRIASATMFSAVLMFGFALFHFPLLDTAILSGYKELIGFLGCYSNFPKSNWFNAMVLVRVLFEPTGRPVSVGLCLLFILGVVQFLTKKKELPETKLAVILISMYILNLLVIIYERKGFPYHFLRNEVPLSIIVPLGLAYAVEQLRQWRNKQKLIIVLYCAVAIGSAVALPAVTISRNFNILYQWLTNQPNYYLAVSKKEINPPNWTSFHKIMQLIDSTSGSNSKVINLSIDELPLILHAGYTHSSSFAHSYIYRGGCDNASFLAKAVEDYKRTDWIVARDNDNLVFVIGDEVSSYASIRKNPELNALLDSNFVLYSEIDGFKMFLNRQTLHRIGKLAD